MPNTNQIKGFTGFQPNTSYGIAESAKYLPEIIIEQLYRRANRYNANDLVNIQRLPFEQAFDYIKERNLYIDWRTFHLLIRTINKTDEISMGYLKYFFLYTPSFQLESKNVRNRYFYSAIINQCKQTPDLLLLAMNAFDEAVKNNQADIKVYNSYIDITGKNHEFLHACYGFEKAVSAGIANEVTYTSFIDVAGINGMFEEAKAAYEEAKYKGISSEATYNAFLKAADRNDKFEEAKAAYEEAKDKGVVSKKTFNILLQIAGKNDNLKEVNDAYLQAKKIGLVDAVTNRTFIDIACKSGNFDEAMSNCLDAGEFMAVIKAADESANFDAVKAVFELAKTKDIASVEIFNIFIKIADRNHKFDEVEAAFMDAKLKALANQMTFNNFINIAGKHSVEKAKMAFDEAAAKNYASLCTCNIFIDVLLSPANETSENKEIAERVFDQYVLDSFKRQQRSEYIFDLHKLSYGTAELLLKKYCYYKCIDASSITIIYGKGSHRDDGKNPMKDLVLNWINRTDNMIINTQGIAHVTVKYLSKKGNNIGRYNPQLVGVHKHKKHRKKL